MLFSPIKSDEFGFPRDDQFETKLIGLTAGTDWFACYKFADSGEWFVYAVPQFMTVSRRDKEDGDIEFCMFGVNEFLGRIERMDTGQQFMGYAHTTEFTVPGELLTDKAKDRMEIGEVMCGDPTRHLTPDGSLLTL